MRFIRRTADKVARLLFAPFAVTDDLGTFRLCWNYAEALSWLAVCGPHAIVWNSGRIVAMRDVATN